MTNSLISDNSMQEIQKTQKKQEVVTDEITEKKVHDFEKAV